MKKYIKNLAAAIIVVGAVLGIQSAFAQTGTFVQNDLYLGFENSAGGGTADYLVNLGTTNTIGVGSSAVVDLSSDISYGNFTSASLVGTNASAIVGGVVGGSYSGTPSSICVTLLRTSNIGVPSSPGSTQPANSGENEDTLAMSAVQQINAPVGIGTGLLDTSKSWEADIEPTYTANTFYGNTQINPDSSATTSGTLYEDLWFTASAGGSKSYNYLGYFTLSFSGSTPHFTFTPKNAPVTAAPQTTTLSVSANGNTITLVSSNAVSGQSYQLQRSANLIPASWSNVGSPVTATGTRVTNVDTTATASQEFYRVQP